MSTVLIYGAAGYIGDLTARRCAEAGLAPIVAGRDAAALARTGGRWALGTRVFRLDDPVAVTAALDDVDIVLNAAGPFEVSGPPLLRGCLATGTHYLDLAGEVPAVGEAASHDEAARGGG